ncbi:nitroreductase family deazaflavin-dependent oxidoreductase [Georgenia alba]|uniref:Nitroreductase family deazaflavin-dependent oxidoreductase n=1 Tax=Georgenia alba TaxID=2233858 RepID=A0ABW2Q996_9MICO
MSSDTEYLPSPSARSRNQVEEYESSGGTRANTLEGTGMPVVIVTMRGARSGKIRKVPLMRVEHDGAYLAVASMGGAPQHPQWYHNLVADPWTRVQDGPEPVETRARLISGAERAEWWERAVAAYPPYAEYQQRTEREIPLFLLEPTGR